MPLVNSQNNLVTGFVKAREMGIDSLSLDLYRGDDYAMYYFNEVPEDSINANKAATQIMVLNYEVFGYEKFVINDPRLFAQYSIGLIHGQRIIRIKSITQNQTSLFGQQSTICYWYGNGDNCTEALCQQHGSCDWDDAGFMGNGQFCSVCCHSFCIDIPNGGGDGGPAPGPGTGTPEGGGEGGGGGGGGGGTPFPCASSQAKNIPPAGCTPVSTPPVTPTSSVTSLVNNVQNPCLNEVYNLITATTYKNKVANLLDNFIAATNMKLTLVEAPVSITDNAYAITEGNPLVENDYKITFDNVVLPKCSKEFILLTYFHEAIHVWLKTHLASYDFENIGSHTEMLSKYYTDLKNTVKSYFPNMNDRDIYALLYDDIDNTAPVSPQDSQLSVGLKHNLLIKIINLYPGTDENDLAVIAEQYEQGGALGTRTTTCY